MKSSHLKIVSLLLLVTYFLTASYNKSFNTFTWNEISLVTFGFVIFGTVMFFTILNYLNGEEDEKQSKKR